VWKTHELVADAPEGAVEARLSIVFAQAANEIGAVHVDAIEFSPASSDVPNSITAAERDLGWELLFNGQSTEGWRGYRMSTMPPGWKVGGGELVCGDDADRDWQPGIDLVTVEAFGSFELQFDWKTPPGGNSGVFFRVNEDAEAVYERAPEFEIRDNAAWTDSPYPAGSNYLLHAPTIDATKPVGQWNHAKILVDDHHVEHWLNGVKIVEYELFSADWLERFRQSGFAKNPKFARTAKGPIALQNYGGGVRFRNIKIRKIASARGVAR
jgi:hypothetical protein